jgi:hypothetical protein
MLFGRIVLNFFDPDALLPNVKKRYRICVFGASVDTFFVWKCLNMFGHFEDEMSLDKNIIYYSYSQCIIMHMFCEYSARRF